MRPHLLLLLGHAGEWCPTHCIGWPPNWSELQVAGILHSCLWTHLGMSIHVHRSRQPPCAWLLLHVLLLLLLHLLLIVLVIWLLWNGHLLLLLHNCTVSILLQLGAWTPLGCRCLCDLCMRLSCRI